MKRPETLALEQALGDKYCTPWQFGIHEVTLGVGGHERADFLTMSTTDVIRCFEIKVSRSDLYSKAKLTFCGHYNYLVAPRPIAELALSSDLIPSWVGVLAGTTLESLRDPTRRELSPEQLSIIKSSLVRSMAREINKSDPNNYDKLVRELNSLKSEVQQLRQELSEANQALRRARRTNIQELVR